MKLLRMWYQPEAEMEFSWVDVESMIMFSERHYDYKCRELSNVGGVLYGMRNRFYFPLNLGTEDDKAIRHAERINVVLDVSTVNLLAKCVEQDPSLSGRLVAVVKALNAEYRKLNKGNR